MVISGMEIAQISLDSYTRKMLVSAVDAAQKWGPGAILLVIALLIYITSISLDREV
jgi:hypothetical protein